MKVKAEFEVDDSGLDNLGLDEIWPGGMLPTPEDVFYFNLERIPKEFIKVSSIAWIAGLSGAMRWPWSREAPIRMKTEIKL